MDYKKIEILVACHKPDSYLKNEVYTPIHVGRSISKYSDAMLEMIGDDTGDNISDKNPYYCELTAQYWAWKNLNVKYVGLAHYRRYFRMSLKPENVDKIFKKYDIVLSREHYEKYSMADKITMDSNIEDLYIFVHCVKRHSPEYLDTVLKVLSQNHITPFNMFVMRKSEFDKFAEWQFQILFEMEKTFKPANYTRAKRILGYLGELMLYIYVVQNHLKIKYDTIVDNEGKEVMPLKYKALRKLFVNIGFNSFYRRPIKFDNASVMVGLKNDGIELSL